jgi:gliding motility-associated-like protein
MNIKFYIASLILFISGSVFAQPSNDDPCGALPINIGPTCSYTTFDNIAATGTASVANPTCGMYNGEDVWFVAIVPPSGVVNVDASAGTLTNINAAVYTATTCAGPFTEVGCDLDGSNNALMPLVQLTGLTPGTYLFIRVWDNYSPPIFLDPGDPLEQGTFDLCVYDASEGGSNSTSYDCGNTPPAGDDCANATPICTFDGYCGSTQGYTDQAWTNLDSEFCGSIENNSFLTFTASSTTVQLNVDVTDPINDCGTGIQFFMFSASGCSGPVVDYGCESPMNLGTNTFTGTGLTPGDTYYLMVDGWAGDICDYVIQAVSGVEGSLSVGGDQTICLGSDATIIATGQDGNPVNWTGQFLNQSSGDTVVCTPGALGTYMIIGEAPALVNNCGGVSDTMYVTVVDGSAINVSAGPCDANGNVVLTATGGTAYMWEPVGLVDQTSGNSVTITPTFAATFYVYGQNGDDCMDTTTLLVQPCASCNAPTINITAPSAVCEPGTIDIATAVGNPDGATLSYYTTLADAQAGTNPMGSTVVNTVGTTTYYVLGVDPSDPTCFTIEQITVTINPLPSITAPNDFTACPDEDIVLIATNPDGANISWDNGVTDGQNFQQPTVGTTTYTVTAELNGCISTDEVDITVNPSPTLTIPGGNTQVVCAGQSATFTASLNNGNGATTYEWTDGSGTVLGTAASETFSPAITSWYYIEASDDCYTLLDSVKVTIGTVDITAINLTPVTDCAGGAGNNDDGAIQVVPNPVTGNYSFTLNPGSVNNATGTFTNLTSQTYQINITDNVTGCSLDTTIFLNSTLGAPPSIASSNVTHVTCAGDLNGCIDLNGINGTVGNLPFDITFTPQSGAPIVQNGVISGTLPQDHQLCGLYGSNWSVDITDQQGCAFNILLTVNEPAPINLGLTSNEPLCYGQSNGSVYINATGGTTPFTFSIFDDAGTQLNQNNSNAAEQIPTGWYFCELTDANGCFEEDSIFLDQPDSLHATLTTVDPLCANDNSGWAQVDNVFNNQGDVLYQWNPNPSESVTDSTWILPQGDYTITIVDSVGCIWQGAFTLTDPPALVIQTLSAEDSYCRGSDLYPGSGTVSGTASGGTGTPSYQWVGPDGLGANTSTWGNRTPGWYTLCALDVNGCVVCDSVYVDSLNPVADFTANPLNGTEPVTVTITDASQDRVTNTWAFFSSSDTTSNSFIIGYDSLQPAFDTTWMADNYTICLIVANDFECYDTLCTNVEIFPQPDITLPNVITPNGDGNNDVWSPISEGMAELNCTILNRWGHTVAVLDSPTATWDGSNSNSGKPVSDGVYTFVYTAKALNGTEFSGQGFIHVISK